MQSPPTPYPPLPNPNPNHNLTSAYLFLRTASTAVTNLTAQTASTKASLSQPGPDSVRQHQHQQHMMTAYEAEARDLALWEARLVQAGVGVVNWVAKVRTGRWLPGEILGMVAEFLRVRVGEDDGLVLVLPDVW